MRSPPLEGLAVCAPQQWLTRHGRCDFGLARVVADERAHPRALGAVTSLDGHNVCSVGEAGTCSGGGNALRMQPHVWQNAVCTGHAQAMDV